MCRFLHVRFYCSQPRHGRIPYMDHPDSLDESEKQRLAEKLVLEQKGHTPCPDSRCLPHEMTEDPVLLVCAEGHCRRCAVEVAEQKIRRPAPEWDEWYRHVTTRGGAEYEAPRDGEPLDAETLGLACTYVLQEQRKSLAEVYLQIPRPAAAPAETDDGDAGQTTGESSSEKGPAMSKVGILARLAGRNLYPNRFRRSLWGVYAIHDRHISCYSSGMVFPFLP